MIRAVDLTDAEAHATAAESHKMTMSRPDIPAPDEWLNLVIDRASSGALVGTWKCGPHSDVLGETEHDEFMYIVKGSVSLIYSDGTTDRFGPGSAIFLPRGFKAIWKQTETVVKFFAIIR